MKEKASKMSHNDTHNYHANLIQLAKNKIMKKLLPILFLFAFIGCGTKVYKDCIVMDKYRTSDKYGHPTDYMILKDKATGVIYEKTVSAAQYLTPIRLNNNNCNRINGI